jgi:RNA polymerase sigma factor (sigma-70 family)
MTKQAIDLYDPSIQADLDALDWENDVLPRAMKYATAASRELRGLGYEVEPADLVQEAITRVYEGRRRWDKMKLPDFGVFLNGIIKSLISHVVERSKKFPSEPLLWEEGSDKNFAVSPDGHIVSAALIPQPADEALIEAERLKPIMDALALVESESDEMGLLILCIRDGMTKPSEIAAETGLDLKTVYKLKERLKERLKNKKALPQKGGKKHGR